MTIDLAKLRVWYDRRRGHYVSNAALIASPQLGLPAPEVARRLVAWLAEHHPEYECWAS